MTASVIDLSSRAKIIDVREQRRLATPLRFEYRTDGAAPQVVLEGYAATFSPYDVYGGPAAGGWVETIHSRAFDRTLGATPDVQLLLNHEGLPLARTKSGTLHLQVDSHGLLVRASLDPSDPDVQRLMPKMRRGDMDEMSFAFRVRDQEWDSSYTNRTITEVNLQKGDVSVVNYGMNPNTAAMLSSEAVSALAQLSNDDLMELRKMDREQVRRAMAVLRAADGGSKPKKYADVSNFADPGYLDNAGKPAKGGNGVKRYPLNSAARVRNALARFAQNKGRYSSEQQSAILGKIRSAAKKFGIKVGDESKAAATLSNVDHIDLQPNAAGGTTLVAVLEDGSRVPLPSTSRGSAFKGAPYVWNPNQYPIDPHEEDYDKETHAMAECNDPNCDNPDHDHDDNRDDDESTMSRAGNFGGKKAKPFGGDDDDDDDEGRADFPDAGDEMGDYEGTDAQGAIGGYDEDEGEHESELSFDLGLAAALESTIAACYKLAEGNDELRKLLSRARRQIGELQGDVPPAGDVSAKLAELRAMTGEPGEKFTVTDGLRALREAGFADTMQPKAS
jgi:HK97 family phage prohead protease